ncbi:hypothetical protein K466DRAFT_564568 [Polyporus arcularius HHB13444]|uniref:Uncharacterized protein n=1 Tax=Polyporus arcularius HHB13444 TaxID=1314778 RepID=A0A5C3PHJ9_9APHY|nr:hypothetical protein K466DRAFT_564568 [Polyporus arcularius HHB13444]
MSEEASLGDALPNDASRRYNTRAGTRVRRPGAHPGLHWEADLREKQAAEADKAHKKAQEDLLKKVKARDVEIEASGVARIAELELARELEDLQDERDLEARTAHGYWNAPKAGTQTHVAPRESSEPSGSEFQEENEGVRSDEEDDEAEEEEEVAVQGKGKKAIRKTNAQRRGDKRVKIRDKIDAARPAKTARLPKHSPAINASPNVFNPVYRQQLLGRTMHQSLSPAIMTPPSVGRIRPEPPRPMSVSSRPDSNTPMSRPGSPAEPETPTQRSAAFDMVRFDHLRIRDTSSPTPSGSRRASVTPARRRLQSLPAHEDKEDSASRYADTREWDLGGFRDEDAAATRESIIGRKRGRPAQTLAVINLEPDPASGKPKTKRRTADVMPSSKSLSAANLPPAIYVFYDSKLLPTCYEIYGGFKDSWTIEPKTPNDPTKPKPPGLVDILTLLINEFSVDGGNHVVEDTDLVFKVTRQRLINWRDGFLNRALTVVKEGYKTFLAQHKAATKRNATIAEVVTWADDALDRAGGEAWWEHPMTARCDNPQGMFKSVYMLRTFGPHLGVINDSCLEEAKPQFGALAMAAAAVEVAFKCFRSGTFAAPEGNFEKIDGADLSCKWASGGVIKLYNKQSRWDSMMDAAQALANARGRKRTRTQNFVDQHDRDMDPDSSSPARPE